MELVEYREFIVEQRAAPPRPLLDSDHFRLLHCALGLSTELLELQLASTRSNVLEELGDFFWYLIYTANTLQISDDDLLALYQEDKPAGDYQDSLVIRTENFISLIKKHSIYGTPQELQKPFLLLLLAFYEALVAHNYPLITLIEDNTSKLEARYKGAFTPQESLDRADKVEEKVSFSDELEEEIKRPSAEADDHSNFGLL